MAITHKTGLRLISTAAPQKMTFPIGPEYFIARGIRLTGTNTGTTEDTREALELVRTGKVKPITIEKKLEDISTCLKDLEEGTSVGRFVVTF
jgi:propanol-preferring alcohol dehydrogenase